MESPYEVLGLEPGADETEIERAYRRRVKETHPDQGGSAAEFLQVRNAYEQLVDGDVVTPEEAQRRGDGQQRARRRNGHAQAGGGAGSEGDNGPETEPGQTYVEYLNFDVLADHDWALEAETEEGEGEEEEGKEEKIEEEREEGGEADEDLFERAAAADLDPGDYGEFVVEPDETLLEAAERHGHDWPYSCRGGACANCAVAVLEGELSVPVNHILPEEMIDRDLRLSCIGEPETDVLRVVFNVKHLPELDELRLPPHPASR